MDPRANPLTSNEFSYTRAELAAMLAALDLKEGSSGGGGEHSASVTAVAVVPAASNAPAAVSAPAPDPLPTVATMTKQSWAGRVTEDGRGAVLHHSLLSTGRVRSWFLTCYHLCCVLCLGVFV